MINSFCLAAGCAEEADGLKSIVKNIIIRILIMNYVIRANETITKLINGLERYPNSTLK
jgi:hypothetical protein